MKELNVLTKEAILAWFDRVTKVKDEPAVGSSDSEDPDEILEIIGEEMRAKNVESMTKFVNHLKTTKDKDSSSSSSSDSDSDSSKSSSDCKKGSSDDDSSSSGSVSDKK